jgi:DNA-binding CsgD family transcriptional regulator
MDQESVIDEIYEAAVVPGMWLKILDRMAEIAGGEGTLMFADAHKGSQLLCSESIEEVVRRWSSEGWVENDERARRLIPRTDPRFLTDLDAFEMDELSTVPIYRDFFWKIGFGWTVGTTIRSPTSDTIVFSVQRKLKNGPVEPEAVNKLDRLRPHLARSAVLSAKVGIERAWSSVSALEAVGLPAAVLSASGKVIAANPLLAKLDNEISIGSGDQLRFKNRSLHDLYLTSLKSKASGGAYPGARSFPYPRTASHPPAVVHVMPLRGLARDIFGGASSLLFVTILSQRSSLPDALLQSLFDLTPAEARVAGLIGNGHTVDEVARDLNVRANTVRTHLKSIFTKTGVGRQADLSGLVTIQTGA